jgi:hypothetical protein|tara:strand:- start:560 stop:838 length:279 start_codon:yes stop_codon:yes gene_type:complete
MIMADNDFTIEFNVYERDKKGNQPDWDGKIDLNNDDGKDLLRELVKRIKNDPDNCALRVAMWNRVSKNKKPYKYVRIQTKFIRKEQSEDIPF